jgi:hypothetical protein
LSSCRPTPRGASKVAIMTIPVTVGMNTEKNGVPSM